jgi:hypothetical protein
VVRDMKHNIPVLVGRIVNPAEGLWLAAWSVCLTFLLVQTVRVEGENTWRIFVSDVSVYTAQVLYT